MNYYGPHEMMGADGNGTGLYHYCCKNDTTGAYPVGYCSPITNCDACNGVPTRYSVSDIDEYCDKCKGKGWLDVPEDEVCKGHANREDACKHYEQYLIDSAKVSGPKEAKWPKNKCKIKDCNEEATYVVNFSEYRFAEVCEKHANKDTFAQLLGIVSWSLSS